VLAQRRAFQHTLHEEIDRLLRESERLSEKDLRKEMKRIVDATLKIKPASVDALNLAAAQYIQGKTKQDKFISALGAFLDEIPNEVETLITEQRNGPGTLMSQLRHNVEKKHRLSDNRKS